MKRILAAALTALLVLSALAGCGKTKTASPGNAYYASYGNAIASYGNALFASGGNARN